MSATANNVKLCSRGADEPASSGTFAALEHTNDVKGFFLRQRVDGNGACGPRADDGYPFNVREIHTMKLKSEIKFARRSIRYILQLIII